MCLSTRKPGVRYGEDMGVRKASRRHDVSGTGRERLGKKSSNVLHKVPFKRRAFQLCVDGRTEMPGLEADEAELCNSPGSNDPVFNKSSWPL